jgi:fatty-acid desaturase
VSSQALRGSVVVREVVMGDGAVPGKRRSWRIKRHALSIIFVHALAALALLPWFFSWTGVVLAGVGGYAFGTLGMGVGYHRLLTHRSFSCPRWIERTFALIGVCTLQESPIVWVALHRQHHHVADHDGDPHSPIASFFWAHMGWLIIKSDNAEPGQLITRYVQDLTSDPFYCWVERSDNWLKIAMLSWVAFFVAGFAAVALRGGTTFDAFQFGASLLVWGAAVRTVLTWHSTWAVNSVTHVWGYRSYDTPDNSRNNLLIGLLAGGEGWHNNHHADPRSARHGHSWREPDTTWLIIRGLMALGVARNVVLPSRRAAAVCRVVRPDRIP